MMIKSNTNMNSNDSSTAVADDDETCREKSSSDASPHGEISTTKLTPATTSHTNYPPPQRPPPSEAHSTATVVNGSSSSIGNHGSKSSLVVLALFGPSVGPCVGDFSTNYNRVSGRLYASTEAILFYSNLFGYERRLCLLLSDVEDIEAHRSTSIRISMVDCEDHVFRKFSNRDAVLTLLQDLWSRYNHQQQLKQQNQDQRNPSKKLTPLDLSLTVTDPLDENNNGEDIPSHRDSRPHLSSELTPETSPLEEQSVAPFSDDRPRQRSLSVPSLHIEGATVTPNNASKRKLNRLRSLMELSTRAEGNGRLARGRPRNEASDATVGTSTAAVTASTTTTTNTTTILQKDTIFPNSITSPGPSDMEIQQEWEIAKQPYEDVALEATKLRCSLETFMDMFFSNEASYPISKYQIEEIADKDVAYSKWKKLSDDDYNHRDGQNCTGDSASQQKKPKVPIFERQVSFIHPLNNSMGPSQAATTRKQRFQRFGNYGLCLSNVTEVKGIPGADTFRVEDKWILSPTSSANNQNGDASSSSIEFVVYFQVVFTKRSMFKTFIQKNIRLETKKWFRGYLGMVQRALMADEDKKEEETQAPNTDKPIVVPVSSPLVLTQQQQANYNASPWYESWEKWLDLVIKLGTLGILLGLLFEVFYLHRSILSMKDQLILTQRQNEQLLTIVEEVLARKD